MGASKRLSQEIGNLTDHIAASDLSEEFLRLILNRALPELLIKRCGLEQLMDQLPKAYMKAIAAYWIASKFVYKHGVSESNAFAFHSFMSQFSGDSNEAVVKELVE